MNVTSIYIPPTSPEALPGLQVSEVRCEEGDPDTQRKTNTPHRRAKAEKRGTEHARPPNKATALDQRAAPGPGSSNEIQRDFL